MPLYVLLARRGQLALLSASEDALVRPRAVTHRHRPAGQFIGLVNRVLDVPQALVLTAAKLGVPFRVAFQSVLLHQYQVHPLGFVQEAGGVHELDASFAIDQGDVYPPTHQSLDVLHRHAGQSPPLPSRRRLPRVPRVPPLEQRLVRHGPQNGVVVAPVLVSIPQQVPVHQRIRLHGDDVPLLSHVARQDARGGAVPRAELDDHVPRHHERVR
mmetsp:Transcript_265/g.640  ORF Transcript_265/g.640 Transcript_265/m.640 type:complete len:213 (+) Transcript_265:146-784(+)